MISIKATEYVAAAAFDHSKPAAVRDDVANRRNRKCHPQCFVIGVTRYFNCCRLCNAK